MAGCGRRPNRDGASWRRRVCPGTCLCGYRGPPSFATPAPFARSYARRMLHAGDKQASGGTMEVALWLHSLGLQQYEDTFRRNAIGVDVVPDLTDEHLREMGLPVGHRLKLLKAIAALRAGPASLSGPAVPTSESVEGERRQVTVLFADLAGYTVLSNELDPEELTLCSRGLRSRRSAGGRARRQHRQAYRRLRNGGIRCADCPWQRCRAGCTRGARHPRRHAGFCRPRWVDHSAYTSGRRRSGGREPDRQPQPSRIYGHGRKREPGRAPDR